MGRQTRLLIGTALGAMFIPISAASATVMSDSGPINVRSAPTTVTVKAGDYLSAIAVSVERTWPQLAGYNHLANPNIVIAGEVLKIPPKGYVPPPAPPTPTQPAPPRTTATYVATGASNLEACILWAESRTVLPNRINAYETNASGHWGAYQFSQSRWVAAGGNKDDWGHVGFAEQQQVFHRAIAMGMAGAWTNYDGC